MRATSILPLTVLAALTAATTAPGRATAGGAWVQLADLGARRHEPDDLVRLRPRTHLDRVQVRASRGTVALAAVELWFGDGTVERVAIDGRLASDDAVTIDLPPAAAPVAALVLDYGAVAGAPRVRVFGLTCAPPAVGPDGNLRLPPGATDDAADLRPRVVWRDTPRLRL